jgi:putative ABC transport system permease protein
MVELKAVDGFYPLYGRLETTPAAAPGDLLGETDGIPGALAEPALLTQLGVAAGDIVRLGDIRVRITAVIDREPDRMSGARYTLAPRLMVSDRTFAESALGGLGSQISHHYRLYMPQLTDRAAMTAAEERLEAALGDGWRARSYYNAAPGIKRSIDQMTLFLTLIGLSTLLIGGVGISNAVRGWLQGRMATLATFKSLGASRALVLRVYLLQVLAVATLGIFIGLVLGGALALIAAEVLTARLSLTNQAGIAPLSLLVAAIFGYLTVFCFTLWPLGRAADVAPRDLFRDRIAPVGGRPRLTVMLATLVAALALAFLAIATASDRTLAAWFVAGTLVAFGVFQLYAAAEIGRAHV